MATPNALPNSRPAKDFSLKGILQAVTFSRGVSTESRIGHKDDDAFTIDGKHYQINNCESHFNSHPMVNQSMLIRVGALPDKLPALVVEPNCKVIDDLGFSLSLLRHARENENTVGIEIFYYCSNFPKTEDRAVARSILERWAQKQTHLANPFC